MSEEMKNLNNEQPAEETVVEKVEPAVEAKKPLDKKTIGIIAGVAAAAVVVLVLVLVLTLGGNKAPALNDYTLGLGTVVSLESSKTGTAQVDATIATVVLDKDGKIVLCRVDAIQNKISIADGVLTVPAAFKTKMEQGDDYNMAKYGHSLVGNETVKEWYEQAKAFETWCVGKTVSEIENMGVQTMDNGYVISSDKALLDAGCTISITDFRDAVVKACKDDQGVAFQSAGNFTLGVSANSADSGSTAAAADKDGAVQVYSDIAASVVEDGKILASLNDAIQPKVSYNTLGEITAKSFKATKRELKEDYNMAKYGHSLVGNETVVEWYLQSAAFSKHVVGKTSADVQALPTQTMDNGYVISNDQALLGAGCTMSIDAIIAVVVESVANAR